MEHFQPIYNIAELCSQKGLANAILCPGSRCAPLTLAFARHKKIKCRTITDERSAGFIGLGLAQQTQNAVILVSTSGTAAYNLAPAVAEAYFSNTPLIVFTADRPSEWIGQHDGQTIHQQHLFGKHVKAFYNLPQDYDHGDDTWAINRMVNEAVNIAMEYPQGPVHINAPFREPLYPVNSIKYDKNVRVIAPIHHDKSISKAVSEYIKAQWKKCRRVLIVGGQQKKNSALLARLKSASNKHSLPVAGDILSNLHSLKGTIRHADLFLGQCPEPVRRSLRPELLITFGDSVISKNLKLYLRKFPAREHWHIQPAGIVSDTFQQLTKIIRTTPETFFEMLESLPARKSADDSAQQDYLARWGAEEKRAAGVLKSFLPGANSGELDLAASVLKQLPETCNLHLANSMAVRYANIAGLAPSQSNVRVFSNRGTSGIDGCTSTAIGHSLGSNVPNILITGDLAFFYDRNAFWNNYPVPNLRVLLLNNHGSIIFKMIDGPGSLQESDEYFVTRQTLNARAICAEFGFNYLSAEKDKGVIKTFLKPGRTANVLELESDIDKNKKLFDRLKQQMKQSYETSLSVAPR